MNRVLIIEDEPMLRETLVRGLGKIPNVETVGAASLESALELVDEQTPAMVISDLDLPGRPGVEIIGELGRRGARIPILFVSAYVRAFAAQIPPNMGIEVLEKPVPLETLREKIRSRLSSDSPRPSGAPFGVAEYLQLACLGRHSVRIEADDDPDDSYGTLIVHEGYLWAASDALGSGEAAFRRIVARPPRILRVTSIDGLPGDRNVHTAWEPLLLDAFREIDERARRTGSPDPEPTLAEAEPDERIEEAVASSPEATDALAEEDENDRQLNALLDEGLDALLSREYPRALVAFRQAQELAPGDRRVEANLERLKALGHGGEEAEEPT